MSTCLVRCLNSAYSHRGRLYHLKNRGPSQPKFAYLQPDISNFTNLRFLVFCIRYLHRKMRPIRIISLGI